MHTDSSVSSSGGGAGGNISNIGMGSVSSSGYVSPSIITLDSPSPPATPPGTQTPSVQPLPSLQMPPPIFPNSMYLSSVPTFLDLDSDSNSPQSSNAAPLYTPRYWVSVNPVEHCHVVKHFYSLKHMRFVSRVWFCNVKRL